MEKEGVGKAEMHRISPVETSGGPASLLGFCQHLTKVLEINGFLGWLHRRIMYILQSGAIYHH